MRLLGLVEKLFDCGDQVLFGEAGMAAFQDCDDLFVLSQRFTPVGFVVAYRLKTHYVESEELDEKTADMIAQEAIAGGVTECDVEFEVVDVEGGEVFFISGSAHPVEGFLHGSEICFALGCEAGGEAFHSGAELVDLADVGGAEADNAGRAARRFFHETFPGKSVDGFADTGLGNAKSIGPVGFDDSFSRGDAAGDDLLTQTIGHRILAEKWPHNSVQTQKTSAQV